jgi:hypothetical protein
LDDVAGLREQWPDLALGLGDGAFDDAEEFGEDVLWCAEALAQHADHLIPVAGIQAGQGRVCPVRALRFAGGAGRSVRPRASA